MNDREIILNYMVCELKKISDLFDRIDKASNSADGRDKSKAGEQIVIDEILNLDYSKLRIPNGKILQPQEKRHWYDVGNADFPINIKITMGKSSDNAGSKEGLLYSLTGYNPENLSNNHWPTYFKVLNDSLEKTTADLCEKDYYFLVINRKTRNIFWSAFRQLTTLTTNGSNLPVQTNWIDNETRQERSLEESKKFLMSAFAESLEKSSVPLSEFKKYKWSW